MLNELFAHVCGQSRCFSINDTVLPVCQRCLGLYAGAAITGAWLAISGVWRRGLPGLNPALVHVAMLMAAMIGGMHVIDFGPTWRLLCGLWTGHVAILWLVGGAVDLRHLSRPAARSRLPWEKGHRVQAVALAIGLAILAIVFAVFIRLGWHFWTAVVILGFGMLVVALLAAVVGVVRWVMVIGRGGWPTSFPARREDGPPRRPNWT